MNAPPFLKLRYSLRYTYRTLRTFSILLWGRRRTQQRSRARGQLLTTKNRTFESGTTGAMIRCSGLVPTLQRRTTTSSRRRPGALVFWHAPFFLLLSPVHNSYARVRIHTHTHEYESKVVIILYYIYTHNASVF